MSTPRINPNDPQWTTFVLGELENDRGAVDHLLDASPEARALVEDLKSATAAIEQALQNDEPLQLTAAQRAAVTRTAEAQASSVLAWLRPRWVWSAAGAVVAVAIIAVVLFRPSPSSGRAQMAKLEPFGATSGGAASTASTARTASASAPEPAASAPTAAPRATLPTGADPNPALSPSTAAPAITVKPVSPTMRVGSTLSGTVRDRGGDVLAGATVEAMAVGGARLTTNTDSQGKYFFGNLDPAQTYHVTAGLTGFTEAAGDFQASNTPRDFTLSVGSLAETVSVTGASPVIDVRNARVAGGLFGSPAPPAP